MFGEKTIYGNTVVKSDSKSRIILPAFTYAEKDDEILVMEYNSYLEIAKEEDINNLINNIRKLIFTTDDEKTTNLLTNKLNRLLLIISKKCIVDSQRRIILTNLIVPNQTYRVTGAKDSVYIHKKGKNL